MKHWNHTERANPLDLHILMYFEWLLDTLHRSKWVKIVNYALHEKQLNYWCCTTVTSFLINLNGNLINKSAN